MTLIESLLDVMNKHFHTGLSENAILGVFAAVCKAVAHMHSQDPPIIHRDLKVLY